MTDITRRRKIFSGKWQALDYLKITILGFGISAFWGALNTLVIQSRLLDLGFAAQKNTWLGLITFVGLIIAMLSQPVIGAASDRATFRMGRRRPFILVGGLLVIMLTPGIGLVGSLAGLFIIYCLLQVSSNLAQAPFQALIPDMVAAGRRGIAASLKNLFDVAGGFLILLPVGYFLGRHITGTVDGWLWLTLGLLALILLLLILATVLTVREEPGAGAAGVSWQTALAGSFRIDLRGNRSFLYFLISRLLILVAFIIVQRYALYFLMDYVGVANAVAVTAQMMIAVGIGLGVSVLFTGYLSDRIGRRSVIVSGGVTGAVGIAVLFFSGSLWQLIMAGSILGLGFGAFACANWALATDLVAPGEEARYLGITNIATAGGGAIVGLMGLLIDIFNADIPGRGYQFMLLTCFCCLLLGALLVLKVKTPRKNTPAESRNPAPTT
jgi:Na+/melibiose symporter-like transporter